ncbi:hypothetical protein Anas_05088, partial [Armadillidium nasatum]
MPENNIEINGNHTLSNNKSHELITDELVKNGLQKDKGKNAELLSWEVKDFTNKGDGYTSFVTSVTVKYRKEGIQGDTSYVLKLNPLRPPGPMTEFMSVMFPREKEILTDALEAMSKHLGKLGLDPIRTPRIFASCLEKEKEALLLENLRTQGFQMHDRRKGQDYHHALLVMEELGRFHASSLLLQESIAPKTFAEHFEYFEEPWFDINNETSKMMTVMLESQAVSAIDCLNKFPKYEKCIKWLEANKQNMGRYFIEGFKSTKPPFEVLVHGDPHTNNMLFKYDKNGIVEDMRFVDLQCCRLSSPGSDINYYAYSSLTGEIRSKHFQKLLYAYYQSFSKVLIFARKKVPYTFKELEDEVENRKLLGFITGLMILQFLLFEDDNEVVDINEMNLENMGEYEENRKKIFSRLSEKEGPFKDRFLSLFDSMLESPIIDMN